MGGTGDAVCVALLQGALEAGAVEDGGSVPPRPLDDVGDGGDGAARAHVDGEGRAAGGDGVGADRGA